MTSTNEIFDYFNVQDTRDVRNSPRWGIFCAEAGIPTDSAFLVQGPDKITVILEDSGNDYQFKKDDTGSIDFVCIRTNMLHTAEEKYDGPSSTI